MTSGSQHQYEELDRIDSGILEMIRKGDWLSAWKASDEQLNFILTSLNYSNLYDMSKDQYRPSTMNFWSWLNLETTRAAIHVGDLEFSDGLQVYMAMVEDTMRSIKPMLGKFLANIYIYPDPGVSSFNGFSRNVEQSLNLYLSSEL